MEVRVNAVYFKIKAPKRSFFSLGVQAVIAVNGSEVSIVNRA